MGNQKSNDDFSKNPNFNMQQHQQAMRNLQANYSQSGYQFNGVAPARNVKVTQTEFKAIHRTTSIYKPSINIHNQQMNIKIQFKYDSDQGSKVEIYIGVTKVDQNPDNHITSQIKSNMFFEENLEIGKKCQFSKEYSLLPHTKIPGCVIILRIMNLKTDEKTQYSIKNIGKQNWKVLLQKLQINNMVTQLDNIYKGGSQSDQCIICFTQKVDTIIQPCNHLCLCYQCCQHVKRSNNSCPICRTQINGFKKIKTS